jgi:hypothetical protein
MAPRKPFLLRIDPALWSDLEVWAQDDLRSVNGQIEYILKQAVLRRKRAGADTLPASETHQPPVPKPPSAKGEEKES